jgi:adenine-specific DNA-methyltransferase
MPSLNWIGREAVLNHHNEIPYRLLRFEATHAVGAVESGNLLVEGDNLEALKALLPYYGGQVKCIYIDPPYNTGNERWVYNDAVNSTAMQAWLGKVVDRDDLGRHDKWLCMMYPRLQLLWRLLREDGSLWVSIDDNEAHHARDLLDEIFGEQNFVTNIIWEKLYSPKSSAKHFSANHDYILVYAKNAEKWERNLLSRTEYQDQRYKNPDNDPRGLWKPGGLDARNYYSEGTYPIITPSGRVITGPPKGSYWRVSKEKLTEMDKDGRIWWGQTGNNIPAIKRFLTEVRQGIVPETIWGYSEVGHTQEAKQEIVKILSDAVDVFTTPKPTRLIQRILQLATNPGDLVLDSFAGSGTTGHAVLQQNTLDAGGRHFILVEIEPKIAQDITAERLRRVIEGYEWNDQKGILHKEPGLGSGFRYCTIGPSLFDENGMIRTEVTFAELAAHIFFSETGQPVNQKAKLEGKAGDPLIGTAGGVAYYLFYNGKGSSSLLDQRTLKQIQYSGPAVVYADSCTLSPETLKMFNITFKQIPYQIETS